MKHKPARTVKPRVRGFVHKPIIATDCREVLTEDGTSYPMGELGTFVTGKTAFIIATFDPGELLGICHDTFAASEGWQYRLSPIDNPHTLGNITLRERRCSVAGLGFVRKGHRNSGMHQVWSPLTWTQDRNCLSDISTLSEILHWATCVRAFAKENNLALRPTMGGLASQFLRDPRFYPEPRRKVPKRTNELARSHLPGGFNYLSPDARPHEKVVSIDQKRAHHKVVRDTPLPDANCLFAKGDFSASGRKIWAKRGTELYNKVTSTFGLVCVEAHSRENERGEIRPESESYTGSRPIYLWTNDIDRFEQQGGYIYGIYAAWTASKRDEGLPKYAAFADSYLDKHPEWKSWLKPLLHSVYGLLAVKPRQFEQAFLRTKEGKGEPAYYLVGRRQFQAQRLKTKREIQPPFANVIQRGMIEAETRKRTILTGLHFGATILTARTDGLHIVTNYPFEDNEFWSVEYLTNVEYLDSVSWRASQRACLPGRPRSLVGIKHGKPLPSEFLESGPYVNWDRLKIAERERAEFEREADRWRDSISDSRINGDRESGQSMGSGSEHFWSTPLFDPEQYIRETAG